MEGRSLPPLTSRKVDYKVPGKLITKPGKYTLQSRFRSRAEPIYFMKFVGATVDMEQSINEWMIDIHPYAAEFEITNGRKGKKKRKASPRLRFKNKQNWVRIGAAKHKCLRQ